MSNDISRGCFVESIDPETAANTKIPYCGKLSVFDWLNDIPDGINKNEIYEVRFKNTRKGYYYNSNGLHLTAGDIVAVEASPGHDIGIISLAGQLVLNQLSKYNINPKGEFKTIYRKAKATDIEKWKEAIALEKETMIESRKIAVDLHLDMKIGDVEYQGDKTKAIFYYIADDRVDFRQLIKILADRFHIRIEMKQIGARQEAGRIGGIGSCGRQLCCSTWMSNFVSVTTTAARYQELSLNPQKLAGQCCKLKCCLNYEVDAYIDERKDFPSSEASIMTTAGKAYHQKTDVFRRLMWYSVGDANSLDMIPIPVEKVKEYLEMNKRGEKVELETNVETENRPSAEIDFSQVVGQDSLTRFDSSKKKKKKRRHGNRSNGGERNNAQRNEGNKNSGGN